MNVPAHKSGTAGQIVNPVPADLVAPPPAPRTLGDYIRTTLDSESVLAEYQRINRAARLMAQSGDQVVHNIGKAIQYADSATQRRLAAAFPELIERYGSVVDDVRRAA